MNKRRKGSSYEIRARAYLELRGLRYIEGNFWSPYGEIDLIFSEDEVLVFVEVKYRSSSRYGSGIEAVDRRKARRIYLTAMDYLTKHSLTEREVRFDLITFDDRELKWTRNIIWGDSFGF